MAGGRNDGAAYAAAAWCANNILKFDVPVPLKQKFKESLASVIRHELSSYKTDDACCVIQIINGKPNKPLDAAMKQHQINQSELTTSNIMVRVYWNKVIVGTGPLATSEYVERPVYIRTQS